MKIKVFLIILVIMMLPWQVYSDSLQEIESRIEESKDSLDRLEGDIKSSEARAEEAEALKKELQENEEEVTQDIEELENEIEILEEKIAATKEDIDSTQKEIDRLEKEIAETEKIIGETESDLSDKKEILSKSIRTTYTRGDIGFLEFLFRNDSSSNILNRFLMLTNIADANRDLHDQVKELLLELEESHERLVTDQTSMLEEEEELLNLQSKQEDQISDQENLQAQLKEQLSEIEENIEKQDEVMQSIRSDLESAMAQRDDEMERIEIEERRKEEEKRILEEQRREEERRQREKEEQQESGESSEQTNETPSLGSGELGLPMQRGTYRISSDYGWRTHPVTGARRMHNGTDFAAPYGTNIYAAGSGRVLFSGSAPGFGNWIVIDHGNLYTIYGHMYSHQLYVSPGEWVDRGQHIADVGSDGTSTGDHLHFEVATSYQGGSFTRDDPNNYINP